MSTQAVISIITSKPANSDTNAMNLTHFKLTVKERKNAVALKAYAFTVVNLVTKSFPALSSQLTDMSKPFKTFKTL